METALHRFIRLLRLYGVRVSTAEVIDAMHAVAQPGVLEQRHLLHAALTASLVKDRRDLDTFELGDLLPRAVLDKESARVAVEEAGRCGRRLLPVELRGRFYRSSHTSCMRP